jgi:hypothetical protein
MSNELKTYKILIKWTVEEEQILVAYYGKISAKEIHEKFLPNRSRMAIKRRASLLKLDGNQSLLNSKYHKSKNQNVTEKICSKCNLNKSITEFRKIKSRTDSILYDGFCIFCRSIYDKERNQKPINKIKALMRNRLRMQKMRQMMFDHYGYKCACPGCSETNINFLTIEHINNDGSKHRKEVGGTYGVYKDIIDRNFPPEYTVLCYNCNCAKAHNEEKICPHLMSQCLEVI